MGNLQQQCRGINHHLLELDRPEAVYLPNDIISGSILSNKNTDACILLTGTIYYKKRKRNSLEKCKISFCRIEHHLNLFSKGKQYFQLRLDDHLPPSFNDIDTYPNISYTVNLLYRKSKHKILCSIPIRVCPFVKLDRPLLLSPIFFGPVENQLSGINIKIKINRGMFTFNDAIQIFYELQNPNEIHIMSIEVNLGIYYCIESSVYQEDVYNENENLHTISTSDKLVRNKFTINLPKKMYMPPTFKFQYGKENDATSFNLTIDYKIQIKIYLENMENLWQIDVPIIICNDTIEPTHISQQDNNKNIEVISSNVNVHTNIVE